MLNSNCRLVLIQEMKSNIITFLDRPPFMLGQSLAKFYETEPKYINRAVERNPKRFPSDFCFRLTLNAVSVLKKNWCQTGTNFYAGEKKLPYGFTREGANMLSSVLHTDVAIDRSIHIMRAFSAMEHLSQGCIIKIADQFEACKRIAEAAGLNGNQAILSACTTVKKLLGYNPLELIDQTHLISSPQEIHLSPTDIGNRLEISSQKVNKRLEEAKLQESFRDAKDKKCRKPTEKGKAFSVLKDTNKKHKDGRPIQQLMWLESVIPILKESEKQSEFTF